MDDYIAGLASAPSYLDKYEEFYNYKGKIFNLQLRYWVEALEKFNKLDKNHFIVEEAIIIVNCLCSSLEALAGVNINPVEQTPSLIAMYKDRLVKDKGWNLKNEKQDLFDKLKEMNSYYTNICKHINKSDSRREMIRKIDYKKIKEYMGVTQEIWLWVLSKGLNNTIPCNQKEFFLNSFKHGAEGRL